MRKVYISNEVYTTISLPSAACSHQLIRNDRVHAVSVNILGMDLASAKQVDVICRKVLLVYAADRHVGI